MSDENREPAAADRENADAREAAVGHAPSRAERPGVPRWVRVLALIGVALVVLLVVMLLSGHGPAQHLQHSSAATGPTLPTATPRPTDPLVVARPA